VCERERESGLRMPQVARLLARALSLSLSLSPFRTIFLSISLSFSLSFCLSRLAHRSRLAEETLGERSQHELYKFMLLRK